MHSIESILSSLLGWMYPQRTLRRVLREPTLAPVEPPPCVGRDDLCRRVLKSAVDSKCVLLYGGRQSGKTTALLNILTIGQVLPDSGPVELPVYLDLLGLPWDASPSGLFSLLASAADSSLQSLLQVNASEAALSPQAVVDLESLEAWIVSRVRACKQCEVKFIFLLDEAKRILGGRFPRSFQDNLFSLMYGRGPASPHCGFVLAGAQELYGFSVDETSPIGSRAAKHWIGPLTASATAELVALTQPSCPSDRVALVGDAIYRLTGGHAGISAFFARNIDTRAQSMDHSLEALVERFRHDHGELFQVWLTSLTPEARVLHDHLLVRADIPESHVSRLLLEAGLPAYRAPRACDELEFTGLANRSGNRLVRTNLVYFGVAQRYTGEQTSNDQLERDTWALVKDVELGLREVIRAYLRHHPRETLEDVIAKGGDQSMLRTATRLRARTSTTTHGDGELEPLDLLHFLYLGQLGRILTTGPIWRFVQRAFSDKEWIESRLRSITPIRNHYAHFRPVAEAELVSCKVACLDILAALKTISIAS